MILKKNYKIKQSQERKRTLEVSNRYFLINENVVILLECLRDSVDYNQAYDVYKSKGSLKLSYDDFCYLADEQLDKLGFLDISVIKRRTHSYLNLKFKVISPRVATSIGKLFSPLFSPLLFIYLFIGIIAFHLSVSVPSIIEMERTQFISDWPLFFLVLFSVLFHEFGHVAACHRFKVQHQGIGLGFYLIFPVAYSDISGVWILPKQERQIVNIAGVFMEMLYAVIIGIIGLFISSSLLIQISGFLFFISLLSLNPLVRHDGYWILSDWIDTPNLMNASMSALSQTIKRCFNPSVNEAITRKQIFLSTYAILNFTAILILLIIVYKMQTLAIINFPNNLLSFTIDLYTSGLGASYLNLNNAVALAFYFLLLRFIFTLPSLIRTIKAFTYR